MRYDKPHGTIFELKSKNMSEDLNGENFKTGIGKKNWEKRSKFNCYNQAKISILGATNLSSERDIEFKLGDLEKLNCLNSRGDENIANGLAKLINAMKELEELAIEHIFEGQLYEGGGLEIVFGVIGNSRRRKFRTENLYTESEKKEWKELLKILERVENKGGNGFRCKIS